MGIKKTLVTTLCIALLQMNVYANESKWNIQKEISPPPQSVDIKAIATKYQLVFFFAGYCGYCHKFAPIVKAITEEYGFDLVTYSFDGHAIKTLKAPKKVDKSHIEKYFNDLPLALPLLVAQSIKGNERVVISQGLASKEAVISQLAKCRI